MSIIKSIKQVLGLSVTPSENYHWDGSVANKLSLKRGVPGAEGVTVLEADAAIAKFPAMPWADGAPVVESGSNANGSWIRYADGTQLAFNQRSTGSWGAGASVTQVHTFPVAFDFAPWAVVSLLSGNPHNFNSTVVVTTSTTISIASGGATASSGAVNYLATGRWK